MKRKFSILAPLRIPSRAETKALKAHLDNHEIPSPLSPPTSPFINRRELDDHTIAQLKASCTAIVKGYAYAPEPKLNFTPLHHTKSVPHLSGHAQARTSRPYTARHADAEAPPVPETYSTCRNVLNSKSAQDLRQYENDPRHESSRRTHASLLPESRHKELNLNLLRSNSTAPSGLYRPKTAPIDESDGSYATPRTGSTDRHLDAVSTAFTSTAMTPSKPLQRFSSQLLSEQSTNDGVSKVASEQAESWMKQQLQRHDTRASNEQNGQRPEGRSISRSWSFLRRSKKDTARPQTAVEPKPPRHDSVGEHAANPARSSTSHSHVAFTLQQKKSSGSLGVPSSQDASSACVEGTHFDMSRLSQSLNLNRALPPLPRLDTWNKNGYAATVQSEPTPVTSNAPKLHVASLMKANSEPRIASTTSPLRAQHAHSLQNLPFMHEAPHAVAVPSNIGKPRSAGHSKSSSKSSATDSCFSPTSATSSSHRSRAQSTTLSHHDTIPEDVAVMSPAAMSSQHTFRLSDAHSTGRPSTTMTMRQSGEGGIPNFSRKISIDLHGAIRSHAVVGSNPDVTALPQIPPPQQKMRGLRRVFSRFEIGGGGKGDGATAAKKKEESKSGGGVNWMDHFEAEGIKTGILVPRPGSAAAPFVRY